MAIETTTISGLRGKTTNTADIYYTTDLGQEGEWRYDPSDTSSADNVGTILVSSNGMRFKRIYDESVNVKWFGAKGDDITDSTSAFQNAIDFLIDNKGGKLFIPAGLYKSDQIRFELSDYYKMPLIIEGEGRSNTRIKKITNNSQSLLYVSGNSSIDLIDLRFVFKDMTIEGSWGDNDIGVELNCAAVFYLENIEIRHFGIGMLGEGALVFNIENFEVHNCKVGFDFYNLINGEEGRPYANAITLEKGRIYLCKEWGLKFKKGALLTLNELDLEKNGDATDEQFETGCLHIDNSEVEAYESLVNIYNCWFEANYSWTIKVEPNQNTVLNIYSTEMQNMDWANNSIGVEIYGRRSNIISSKFLYKSSVVSSTCKIDCLSSVIIGSVISWLVDESKYKSHIHVSAGEQEWISSGTTQDMDMNGGQGFSEGVRITNQKPLVFANGNPAIENKLEPYPGGGLMFNLHSGSVRSNSDFVAEGNLVTNAGKVQFSGGHELEKDTVNGGLKFTVASGSVRSNSDFIAEGNLVTNAGKVQFSGGHELEKDTVNGGLKFTVASGSVRSNSDFVAEGNLVTNAGKVQFSGGHELEKDTINGGLKFIVASGSVRSNSDFVAEGNLVTNAGKVQFSGGHELEKDTVNGGLKFVINSGSLRCNSDFIAEGDLRTQGAWNTGKLKLGAHSIWVDSTGHLRIKLGDPTSDTDGNLV